MYSSSPYPSSSFPKDGARAYLLVPEGRGAHVLVLLVPEGRGARVHPPRPRRRKRACARPPRSQRTGCARNPPPFPRRRRRARREMHRPRSCGDVGHRFFVDLTEGWHKAELRRRCASPAPFQRDAQVSWRQERAGWRPGGQWRFLWAAVEIVPPGDGQFGRPLLYGAFGEAGNANTANTIVIACLKF